MHVCARAHDVDESVADEGVVDCMHSVNGTATSNQTQVGNITNALECAVAYGISGHEARHAVSTACQGDSAGIVLDVEAVNVQIGPNTCLGAD